MKLPIMNNIGLASEELKKVDLQMGTKFLELVMNRVLKLDPKIAPYLGSMLTDDNSALIPDNHGPEYDKKDYLSFFLIKLDQNGVAEKVIGTIIVDLKNKTVVDASDKIVTE